MGRKGAKLTEEATATAERLVAELEPLGPVTSRKMFGGYGVRCEDVMFILVSSQGMPYLRVDDEFRSELEGRGSESHGKMPYLSVPEWPEAPDLLPLAERALQAARAAAK